MTCAAAQTLVDAHLDGELDSAQESDLGAHLETCPDCQGVLAGMTSLKKTMRERAPYYKAPPGLKRRILAQSRGSQSEGPGRVPWNWLAIAAALMLVASIAGNIALLRARVPRQEMLAANVLSSHVRSLAGTHLLDVPSSDRHTVKPWFAGRLDFSPDVKDFAAEGFPLAGGRLEYLDGHLAAALVFERRKHIINLFTWPSSATEGETGSTRNGYHLIRWTQSGMAYWAVSDVNEAELRQFVELYRR
jgi:anti-sigma factor RsiW